MLPTTDPVFLVIEHHQRVDAAYYAALAHHAAESVKDMRRDHERTALIAFLRTKPKTLAGCVAALRYLTDYTKNNGDGLFSTAAGELTLAGAAFLPMIADVIESLFR
jgi:hypothetical protein